MRRAVCDGPDSGRNIQLYNAGLKCGNYIAGAGMDEHHVIRQLTAAADAEHRQQAATLPKVLVGIVIGDSMTGAQKNPAKVKAAQVRWAKRDQLRDTQARRLEGG